MPWMTGDEKTPGQLSCREGGPAARDRIWGSIVIMCGTLEPGDSWIELSVWRSGESSWLERIDLELLLF